jgi:hypothetical protein
LKLYQNTRYKELAPKWRKYKDWYEADHDTLVSNSAYLIPHPIELMPSEEAGRLYNSRKNRTEALKGVEMCVSIWTSILFRESPTFDKEAFTLLERTNGLEDIDGQGTSFESFIIEELSPQYLVYGDIAILAESFTANAISAGQEQELGLRPYLKIITPLCFTDWAKETANASRLGKLNFARYEYFKEDPRYSETDEIKRYLCSDSFRRDASGNVLIQKYESELDDHGQPKKANDGQIDWTPTTLISLSSELKEIPISLIQKESWVDGVCAEAKRHFNHRSNLDSINHFQGYPSTFIFGVDPSDAKQYKLISEYTLTFVKDTEARVERLQAGDSAGVERAVDDSLNMMFKVALDQVRSLPTDSKAVQGADTISEEKRNLYTLLVSTISRLENITQQALDNYALLAGEKEFKGKVTFNREIKEEDINQLIKIFNSFGDILKPIEGMSEAMAKKIIPKLKFDPETTEELLLNAEKADLEKKPEEETDPVDSALQ